MKLQFDAILDFQCEACETQVWIEFARRCDYLNESTCEDLDNAYDQIHRTICENDTGAGHMVDTVRCG